MKKMNNKGFSLVELIVVVLIMAIIAVALAPQVMKWVENSRKSTDSSNYDSIYSAANIAIGNELVLQELKSGNAAPFTIECTTAGEAYNNGGASLTNFAASMDETLGSGWATSLKTKAAILDCINPSGTTGASGYQITVTSDGHVERSWAPYNPNT
jgi:type IV pilus assembly protein PilA